MICDKLVHINNIKMTCSYYRNLIGSIFDYINQDDLYNIKFSAIEKNHYMDIIDDYKFNAYIPLENFKKRIKKIEYYFYYNNKPISYIINWKCIFYLTKLLKIL